MPDRLFDLFADVLDQPIEAMSEATAPLNTPAWDSLASVNLTVAIEQEFRVRLSTQEVVAMNSIGAARAVLIKKGVTAF